MKQIKVMTTALLLMVGGCFTTVQAQSWGGILGGIASAIAGKKAVNENSVVGTWTYVKPACKFESDNVLAGLGGKVAEAKLVEKMQEELDKYGLSKIGCSFTFNEDKTFKYNIGKLTRQGTYTVDTEKKQIVMKPRLGKAQTAMVEFSGADKMCVYFDADGLMKLVQGASKLVSKASSNSTLSLLSNLTEQYKGVDLGVELQKKK